MGGGKSVPSYTPVATTTQAVQAPEVADTSTESATQTDAREKQLKAAAAASGRSGTILTGSSGDGSAANTDDSLLGGF